jgi:hypothetical protein
MSVVDFENSNPDLASLNGAPDFKIAREDWTLFRTVEGLSQRAGVAPSLLPRLVAKELADNALDEAGAVEFGWLANGFVIEDRGRGIEGSPEDIAALFSIRRPMVSTKLLRLPTRGALGNGLRVVAGAVLASAGTLAVTTRNQRITLRPERDGSTTVAAVEAVAHPIGTRVEIEFGPALAIDEHTLHWARLAREMAGHGTSYRGQSSPHWYDAPQFHELLDASGPRPVRDLIANLDGCSGPKAGEIVAAAGLTRALCSEVRAADAERLLRTARDHARLVSPKRLGSVGPTAYPDEAYGIATGTVSLGAAEPYAEIPYVAEAWAWECARHSGNRTTLSVCINRTPTSGQIGAARDNRDIDAYGCGLSDTIATAPKAEHFQIHLNITTPYMPITSDGKAPNLEPFLDVICSAAGTAVRKAHRPNSRETSSQKAIVLDNLDNAIAAQGGMRFNERQLFYVLRDVVKNELDQELKIGNFKAIITDYENENGEIEGMYREPRGSIYHPHTGETIMLGTLMVEKYERPVWTYNKIVYIEKEGFSEALKAAHWAERHDCMLMSSKGFTTRAARDLVDALAEHDEPVTVFCVHDADAWGTMIQQTFQEETRARGARKIEIVNLGLEPWEAEEMGLGVEDVEEGKLGVEDVEEGKKDKPVANYVRDYDETHGTEWTDWLGTHRTELNAMTTPRFIEWLDGKMADYEKLIPPPEVLAAGLDQEVERQLRERIQANILREAEVGRGVRGDRKAGSRRAAGRHRAVIRERAGAGVARPHQGRGPSEG